MDREPHVYIGVDPGIGGSISFIHEEGGLWSVRNGETLADICEAISGAVNGSIPFAMLEVVHSSPQMGVKSAFTFGRSYGQLETILTALGIPFERVRPIKWQTAMQCRTKGDKNVSKRKAQELFPGARVVHANADSLLLAEYARRNAP